MIAMAVLAGTAAMILRGKLEAFVVRLSPALRQVLVEWWPLLLILAGTVLLFEHYRLETADRRSGKQSRANWPSASSSATSATTTRGTHAS
jgi:hypothetical protein